MMIKAILTALLMSAATFALAAARADIVVEGVQMPVWVEHASGARGPLATGKALANKDRIYTGSGARALLRLADADTQEAALGIYDGLRDAGFPAEIQPVQTEAGLTYRVRISNVPSRREAHMLAARIKGKMDLAGPTILP